MHPEDFEEFVNLLGWEYGSRAVTEDEEGNPVDPWLDEWVSKWEPLGPDSVFRYQLSVPPKARDDLPRAERFMEFAEKIFARNLEEAVASQ